MKISGIQTCGLRGATPEGGWSNELRPDDVVHTLVAVHTDSGHVGSVVRSPLRVWWLPPWMCLRRN